MIYFLFHCLIQENCSHKCHFVPSAGAYLDDGVCLFAVTLCLAEIHLRDPELYASKFKKFTPYNLKPGS